MCTIWRVYHVNTGMFTGKLSRQLTRSSPMVVTSEAGKRIVWSSERSADSDEGNDYNCLLVYKSVVVFCLKGSQQGVKIVVSKDGGM